MDREPGLHLIACDHWAGDPYSSVESGKVLGSWSWIVARATETKYKGVPATASILKAGRPADHDGTGARGKQPLCDPGGRGWRTSARAVWTGVCIELQAGS